MKSKKNSAGDVIAYILLILFSFYVLAPLFIMLLTSFKDNLDYIKNPIGLPDKIVLDGFKTLFSDSHFLTYLRNSLVITGISLVCINAFSVMLSYALARYTARWVKKWYFFFLAGMIIPIRLGVLFLNDMFNWMNLLNTPWALIFIYIAMSIPFSMFILTGYIKMIPREMDEAAYLDGCTTFRLITTMIVPLLKPAIATVAIYNFVPIWNDVYFPLIFIFDDNKKTFMLQVTNYFGQYSTDWNLVYSALTFAAAVSLVFYAFFSKYLVKGLTAGALKG